METNQEAGQIPTLTWSIVKPVPAYSNTTMKCVLCLNKKLEIPMYAEQKEFLHKRSEIMFASKKTSMD